MFDTDPPKVLVALAANEDGTAAVAFAAAEARRRRCGVHLAHVAHPSVLGSDPAELDLREGVLRDTGAMALEEAARRMTQLLPDDASVSTELVHGDVASSLARLSAHASLVVLQHQRPETQQRLGLTLSVTSAVAARAHAPVVAVPPGWYDDPARGSVVVGIKDDESCVSLVRAALEEARRRESFVRVVHAWHPSESAPHLGGVSGGPPRLLLDRLAAALEPLVTEYDDVPAELMVPDARPAQALITESETAAVVIAGRHSSAMWGPHLGSVARAVLRESTCPVMVVDPGELAHGLAPAAVSLGGRQRRAGGLR